MSNRSKEAIAGNDVTARQKGLTDDEQWALDDPYCRRLMKKRFYQWVCDQAPGKRLNWPQVSQLLADQTGVHIPGETLRQNFKPVSQKQGKARREFDDPIRWAAIYRFLTSDAVGYLELSELQPDRQPLVGLLALQSFLSPTDTPPFPETLSGRYTNLWDGNTPVDTLMTLDIDSSQAQGIVRVKLREEIDSAENPEMAYTLSYAGAVVWQQSFLAFIVRDQITAAPQIGLVAQTQPQLDQGKTIESLAVWVYQGLSNQVLETTVIDHTVGNAADRSIDRVDYRFDGRIGTYFLTRC